MTRLRNHRLISKSSLDSLFLMERFKKRPSLKSKFSQINDKRFYFVDEITSLLLCLPYLQELIDFKVKKGQRVERYFREENRAQESNERMFLYH